MKKYRRILAGFLAMNLTISMASTNMIRVNADEAYQEETYTAEPEQTYAEEGQGEVVEGNDSSQAPSGGEDASGWITEGEETIQETDASMAEPETNGDDIQEEPTSESDYGDEVSILNIEEVEPDESAVQVATQTDGTLSIKQFNTYKDDGNGNKSVEVKNGTELILLSNCKPDELQDVTINLNITGNCDLSATVKAGTDLSGILNPASDATSAAADTPTEDQEAAGADTVAGAEVQDTEATTDGASEEEVQAQSTDSAAAQDYTYQSLGTEAFPFQGRITGQIPTIKLDKPFFGVLSSSATVQQQLEITWVGDGSVPFLANGYVFQDQKTDGHTLPTLCFTAGENHVLGSILGTVKADDDQCKNEILTINGANVAYNNATVKVSPASGNAGLICNTLQSGNICLDGYVFPANGYTIQAAGNGNAGGIIGEMGANTRLDIKTVTGIDTASVIITSATGNAGGLVGSMGEKATIQNEQAVTLKSQTITGKYAGGVAGMATGVTFTGTGDQKITVDTPTVSGGTNAGAAVGGFIGYCQLKANAENTEQTFPANVTIRDPKVTTNAGTNVGGGFAGGYFGILDFDGKLIYKMTGNINDTVNVTSDGNGEAYGALIGNVISNTIQASLLVEGYEINSNNNQRFYFHGGLIGELGAQGNKDKAVYLNTKNINVSVTKPYADNSAKGFGGLVGRLAKGSILEMQNTTIAVTDKIYEGGGVVGYAEEGSVVKFSGVTDLTGVNYNAAATVGQLVGYQDSALIYAVGDGNGNGWTYKRSNFTTGNAYVNDIGNYGQVIRLNADSSSTAGLSNSLIMINENHEIVLSPLSLNWSSDITINSVDEFALLSIAWNSRGYFSASSGITTENWNELNSRTITLNKDINLEGTGISGLSRDAGDEQAYAGIFNGQNHTIILAIGETFGYKGETTAFSGTDGCGKVYGYQNCHDYQGLFSKTKNPSVIKNLTIAGSINISNAASAITAGGVAAAVTGTTTIQWVTVEERITADIPKNNVLSVGGFFGDGSGSADPLALDDNTKASAKITIQNNTAETDDTKIYAGGVIGQISSGSFKLRASGLTVSGIICTSVQNYAYIGGLAGVVKACNVNNSELAETHWMEIKGLVYDDFTINAENATMVCGGLFGSIWSNVGVFFMGQSDGNDGINIKLEVKKAAINAPKAASVGGLVYRSSGHWEIRDCGIKLENLMINAGKDVGLLVCRGEQGAEKVDGGSGKYGALYLDTTKHWERSYQISAENVNIKTSQQGVFDEFVAYTAASADAIKTSGINGVVSIATNGADNNSGRVGVDPSSTCITYRNRTTYGKNNPTNGCSRYYYDLDQCVKNAADNKANDQIDSQEELMAWSVYRYAYQNIKSFFSGYKVGNVLYSAEDIITSNTIGSTDTSAKCNLDMQKYSYYPIQLDTNVTIQNANIIFYNEEIENAEKKANNKVTSNQTSGASTMHTQHYTMHCGLFLGYTPIAGENKIILNDVTFGGSIGKVADGVCTSGVLFSGSVGGVTVDGKIYMADLQMSDITFDGLKVTNYTGSEYAPLLMNQIDSYTMLNMSTVSNAKYSGGTAVASSMIGNVGSETSRQMNLSFLDIVLPDKAASSSEGIFTHATLLESYRYADGDTSVATYNFYKRDDWETDSKHRHQVTYGREISETAENKNLQKWYYDVDGYGTDSGLVYADAKDIGKEQSFSAWLPYVAVPYNEGNKTHEIKVNQRVYDIVTGCGTYGHPYVITSAGEMTIISEYLSTGVPRNDWKVTITNNQGTLCNKGTTDITFRYNGRNWEEVENKGDKDKPNWVKKTDGATKTDAFMQRYMRNAYYDLQGSGTETDKQIELENFKGFGTAQNPFRGVLTSTNTNGVTLILKGALTGNGLIPYSYGSVVKNLTISYKETGKILTYSAGTAKYYPEVCFGGVIGCVLGGDNIIDNVKVEMDKHWLTISGDAHLLQIGGYVGSVCGGGVLFRNVSGDGLKDVMLSGGSVAGNAYASMYMNPYVGRVLDGFAFYETAGNILDNTDKNYAINTVVPDSTPCISVNDTTITVNDAKGLFLLSAIVNSGAASNGLSNAYNNSADGTLEGYQFGNGKYGKVRNAAYDHIGNVDTAATDFAKAKLDDQSVPGTGNTPYLVTKYASGALFSMAGNKDKGTQIQLASNGKFDMSDYSNGYQGISARYVSSAVTSGDRDTAPIGVVPRISGLNGNGNTLTLNTQVKEYADDDYHAASVGGVFNLLHPAKTCNIQNLTLTGTDKTTGVSLQYYTAEGKITDAASADWKYGSYQFRNNVGVGGIAGSTSNVSASKHYVADIKLQKIQQNKMTIKSPASAGGLIGNAGRWAGSALKRDNRKNPAENIAVLIQPWSWICSVSADFQNCQYSDLIVTGQYEAGGFLGYSHSEWNTTVNAIHITNSEFVVGKNTEITATRDTSYAGGAFGYVDRIVHINNGNANKVAKWENIVIRANVYSGGVIGRIGNGGYYENIIGKIEIKDAVVKASSNVKTYAGGVLGDLNASRPNQISDCSIVNAQINADDDSLSGNPWLAGGVVGQVTGGTTSITSCEVSDTKVYGSFVGGIIGEIEVSTSVTNSTVSLTDMHGTRAGGIAGCTTREVDFNNCRVQGDNQKKIEIEGKKTSGGILGSISGSNIVGIYNCIVNNARITSVDDWGSGGLTGDTDWNVKAQLYFFDCDVEQSEIVGIRVGGIAGNVRGNLNAANLLLKGVVLTGRTNQGYSQTGLLIGLTGNRNLQPMCLAGISIQNSVATDNKKRITQLYGTENDKQRADVQAKSYFSFADYSGTASTVSDTNEGSQLLDNEKAIYPYVVTSPQSLLYEEKSGATNIGRKWYFYGDGASWEENADSSFTVKAEQIIKDKQAGQSLEGHYVYENIDAKDFDFSMISTYNDNQTIKIKDNFPVLQITGGNVDAVTQYLDILTNGGFSAANALNSATEQHVTATATVYTYDKTTGKFTETKKTQSALKITTSSDKKISFSTTTDYDNEMNRYNLLKVTFTEKDSAGTAHNYNVLVPVIVRRMLEMDFSATLSYGTNFWSENYKSLDSHVLESFGSPITGYLRYTYNSDEGVYTDYGWQSYIEAGGNVAEAMKKTIVFAQSADLPVGTQLTLIDCQNDSRAYYYTVKKEDGKGIPLSNFIDSAGKSFTPQSVGELMGATAKENTSSGLFIKVTEDGKPENAQDDASASTTSKPTVRIKNEDGTTYSYYRLARETEARYTHYDISVSEKLESESKSTVSENYYLVLTVPEDSDSGALNGSIQTSVASDIPHQIHYLRMIDGGEDNHSSTASTYQISKGYQQNLIENLSANTWKKLSAADRNLQVDVVDTITFPNGQAYSGKDELYLRFTGGLNTFKTSTSTPVTFPNGATGTAEFYVYAESGTNKTYYVYQNGKWSASGNSEQKALSYPWISSGGSMDVILSEDGTLNTAISLSQIRSFIKGTKSSGDSTFSVELKMTVTLPVSGLDVIPQSKVNGEIPEQYAKLEYSSQLSTVRQSLTYTSNRASFSNTRIGYYKEDTALTQLTYDADETSQLGINLLDLRHMTGDNALIDSTAKYDLSPMKNRNDVLKSSSGIKFTLTLSPKNNEKNSQEKYQEAMKNAGDYLDVELLSSDSGTVQYDDNGSWSWTIPKESYCNNGSIITSKIFDGQEFIQSIRLKVDATNVEALNHNYSNYKVVLTAEILRTNGTGISAVKDTQASDGFIYTLAKIKPEFVDGTVDTTGN